MRAHFPEDLRGDWEVSRKIDSNDPPALLIAAENDPYVPARHYENLADAVRKAGIEATVRVLPSRSHSATLYQISKSDSEARVHVNDFIEKAITAGFGDTPNQ